MNDLGERFREFYRTYYDDRDGGRNRIFELAKAYPNDAKTLEIDYGDLRQYDPDLADDWLDQPETMREYAEQALYEYDLPVDQSLDGANVRVSGLDAIEEPFKLNVGDYVVDNDAPNSDVNKLRVIRGQVSKVAQSKGRYVEITWICNRCSTPTIIPQTEKDEIQQPYECSGCERQGPFSINEGQVVDEDFQTIRVQRPPEKSRGGQQPDDIDITLTDDLTKMVSPGDRVDVATKLQRDSNDDGTFDIVGAAQNIEHRETDFEDINYDEYIDQIKEIAANNPYQKIVDSIMPSHMGDAHVKEAIALQMFGGLEKELADGSTKRGESHMLLVGDPATDKSGLLDYATSLSPRSVYTSGKNASSAGLTCAATQTDFGDGGWTLEAGALVEAHRGLCAIDEFDKMPEEEREGVHEALANGTISPSKAGITNVTLPAETTVIAAANPKYGRFDQYEPIGDQIEIGPTLISRFDLIFTMEDTVDQNADAKLATHLNNIAQTGGLNTAGREAEIDDDPGDEPELEKEMVRAYVAYAKENHQPVLSNEAAKRIKEFYIKIREKGQDEDSAVPITPRKIEALHRLSEAAARIRLSEDVEKQDAERAIELMFQSLQDVGVDPETGEFDADVVETGESKNQRDRIKDIQTVIEDLELENEDGAPIDLVYERTADIGIPEAKVEQELEELRLSGEIYEPNKGHIRLS